MIADFVERRGGGLLMLGGPRSFAEGGYAGTPVADALPLVLDRPAKTARRRRGGAPEGAADARRPGARGHADRRHRSGVGGALDELPPLTSVNPLRALKPGATVLLNGTDERRREQIVLA